MTKNSDHRCYDELFIGGSGESRPIRSSST